MLEQSYFSVGNLFNPVALLDKLLNGYKYRQIVPFHGAELSIGWTRRAENEFRRRGANPLLVEMQLYFSCVIKKRVIFSEGAVPPGDAVNKVLHVLFRTVQASSCDPVEFASNYPVKAELSSPGAKKMHPRLLKIDFRKGEWAGEFEL